MTVALRRAGSHHAQIEDGAYSPGRILLLGRSLDYNGGPVLAMSMPYGIRARLAALRPGAMAIASSQFFGTYPLCSNVRQAQHFTDYLGACLCAVSREFGDLPPHSVYIDSVLPPNQGLGSSAALCVAYIEAISTTFGFGLSAVSIARLAYLAESEILGIGCGHLDSTMSAVCPPGRFLALAGPPFLSLAPSSQSQNLAFVVVSTGPGRSNRASGYQHVRSGFASALGSIRALTGLYRENLGGFAPGEVAEIADRVSFSGSAFTGYFVRESNRVTRAFRLAIEGDLSALGPLMYESDADFHSSLGVIDAANNHVVRAARRAGALGAKVIAGGPGGATVHMIHATDASAYIEELKHALALEGFPQTSFLAQHISEGAVGQWCE